MSKKAPRPRTQQDYCNKLGIYDEDQMQRLRAHCLTFLWDNAGRYNGSWPDVTTATTAYVDHLRRQFPQSQAATLPKWANIIAAHVKDEGISTDQPPSVAYTSLIGIVRGQLRNVEKRAKKAQVVDHCMVVVEHTSISSNSREASLELPTRTLPLQSDFRTVLRRRRHGTYSLASQSDAGDSRTSIDGPAAKRQKLEGSLGHDCDSITSREVRQLADHNARGLRENGSPTSAPSTPGMRRRRMVVAAVENGHMARMGLSVYSKSESDAGDADNDDDDDDDVPLADLSRKRRRYDWDAEPKGAQTVLGVEFEPAINNTPPPSFVPNSPSPAATYVRGSPVSRRRCSPSPSSIPRFECESRPSDTLLYLQKRLPLPQVPASGNTGVPSQVQHVTRVDQVQEADMIEVSAPARHVRADPLGSLSSELDILCLNIESKIHQTEAQGEKLRSFIADYRSLIQSARDQLSELEGKEEEWNASADQLRELLDRATRLRNKL